MNRHFHGDCPIQDARNVNLARADMRLVGVVAPRGLGGQAGAREVGGQ